MTTPLLSITPRVRRTPFTDRVNAAGVKAYTVYNHMLLPTMFESIVADCRHLKSHVQVWDVSCERQVEIRGRDALRLTQMLTPRDLSRLGYGQCFYTPVVDERGGMINDPVTLRVAEDRFWMSLADSDLLLWAKGLGHGLGLDVEVFEPDVSPLAVQGPKAEELMSRVFGDEVRGIRFFRFRELEFAGQKLVVARSGWSRQGGFEIYLTPGELGEPLWDALFAAGADLQVRPGCPNGIERVESGLLSYGSDMTRENNPYECDLGRYCNTAAATGCVGREALLEVERNGPARQIRGLRIAGEALPVCSTWWPLHVGEEPVGRVSSSAFSPDAGTNVAIGMVERSHWEPGTRLRVQTPGGEREAEVCTLPHAL